MSKSNPIPILLYHSIAKNASPKFRQWSLAPQKFEDHMGVLRENGCTPVTVSELVSAFDGANSLPRSPVVLTFDDGFADFYQNAFPILQQYEFPATLYITTSYVDTSSQWLSPLHEGNRQMLTWDQIKELDKYGIECGSHSHTHPELDTLSKGAAHWELSHSKRILEDKLGRTVRSFAYPHGYFSKITRNLVREAGYASACAVKNAFSASHDDRFALSRIDVTEAFDRNYFSCVLNGQGYRVTKLREGPYTKVWRLWRKITKSMRHSKKTVTRINPTPPTKI